MASLESIMSDARTYLRDFPQFFTSSASRSDGSRTFKLPHENVAQHGLTVWATNGTTSVEGIPDGSGAASDTKFTYQLDSRNGLLRIVAPPTGSGFPTNSYVNVEGYFYEWIADQDLRLHTRTVLTEVQHRRDNYDLTKVSDAELDAVALGAAVEALWALLTEAAREVDLSSVEAVSIPSSQRYRQLEDLLFSPNGLMAKYKEKSHMLGIGLDRIEVMQLRRVSRTTGRLVPIYEAREWDDAAYPERIFPAIDRQGPTTPPEGFVPARYTTGFYEEQQAYPNP
jgi:hypothetical protein